MAEIANPLAGVAGPGPFSVRTDLPSQFYGDDVNKIKADAPLAETPDVRPTSRSDMGMAPSQLERLTPLFAPSERKDEPITSGIVRGDGPGPEALGMRMASAEPKLSNILAAMLPYDNTGEIAILYQNALSRGN